MSTLATTALKHASSSSNNIVLDSSGRVGIGTSAVNNNSILEVAGSTFSRIAVTETSSNVIAQVATNTADAILGSLSNHPVAFRVNNTECGRFDTSNNFLFNSGYGSVTVAYGCRAWVNFNGTGVVAIRASGNITSITDNGTGDYTVNFTAAMPDVNYTWAGVAKTDNLGMRAVTLTTTFSANQLVGSVRIETIRDTAVRADAQFVGISVFR